MPRLACWDYCALSKEILQSRPSVQNMEFVPTKHHVVVIVARASIHLYSLDESQSRLHVKLLYVNLVDTRHETHIFCASVDI